MNFSSGSPRACGDAPAERVFPIEQQSGFAVHERTAGDDRLDFFRSAVQPAEFSGERAAEDAFLNPRRALGEFAVSGEAGEFGAGARAAGRAVVGLAGALDEISRVRAADRRRAEQLD